MAQGATATTSNAPTPTSPQGGNGRDSVDKSCGLAENEQIASKERENTVGNTDDQPPNSSDGDGLTSTGPPPPPTGISSPTSATGGQVPKAVEHVLYSDIGINVLLARLKQSIASARDYSTFLKKHSTLEDDHAQGIKKLNRTTAEVVRRQDGRQGSYAHQLADMTRAQDKMADNGIQLALSLHQMHEDLNDMISNVERGRKHWKQEGLSAEKKVKDAEALMEKAKARYDSLAEDYDRVRTGDKSIGRVFTVKGPKSAEKHEEDLNRKLQAADADYASKVQAAQVARHENLNFNRPNAVRNIQELIRECDSALTLQLQKFAAFNEKLLVGNGLIVSPIKSETGGAAPSMREMVQLVDNENDFYAYMADHASQVPPKPMDIKYEKHPTLAASQQSPITPTQQNTAQQRRMSQPLQTQQINPSTNTTTASVTSPQHTETPSSAGPNSALDQPFSGSQTDRHPSNFSQQQYPPQQSQTAPTLQQPAEKQLGISEQGFRGPPVGQHPPNNQNNQVYGKNAPPPGALHQQSAPGGQYRGPPPAPYGQQQSPYSNKQAPPSRTNGALPSRDLPPSKPVFGISLESLFRRDETAVPMVVYQCIQAVDLFGLEVEGIYRLSGNSAHINQLKAVFDSDSSRVDFRNPENFYHDVNSVAGLLKQFLRDLPDPLLTQEHYGALIEAAKIDEDALRRDSLHAVINALPDPNYATLRALVLHLHRVQEHSASNRMSSSNLAICFAPTIMGAHNGPIADAGLQARVVDTILQNTYQIFDED